MNKKEEDYPMRSEEKSIRALSAQAHGEAADNRLLRQKLREKDELISDLRTQIESLNRNLSEINSLKGVNSQAGSGRVHV